MGTRSPLRCFLNGDKIENLKIILSPCLVNISDGDKIPIDMFSEYMGTWLSLCSLNNYMRTWSLYHFVLFERIMSFFFVVILMGILSANIPGSAPPERPVISNIKD